MSNLVGGILAYLGMLSAKHEPEIVKKQKEEKEKLDKNIGKLRETSARTLTAMVAANQLRCLKKEKPNDDN